MAIKYKGKSLSPREQKAKVMEWTGWSSKKYRREYDKLRNRTRNHERATGAERGAINAADLLAREARRQYYAARGVGSNTPTNLFTAISQTTSASTGRELLQSTRAKISEVAIAATERQFHGLLSSSKFGSSLAADIAAARVGKISAAELARRAREYGAQSTALRERTDAARKAEKMRGLDWWRWTNIES